MDKLEKVIKGLEETADDLKAWQAITDKADRGQLIAMEIKIIDAIAMLKAQKPRLLSLDEIVTWNRKAVIERDPIFVEMRPDPIAVANYWTQYMVLNTESEVAKGMYNKVLRCWTDRPTPEQMQEAKWDELTANN